MWTLLSACLLEFVYHNGYEWSRPPHDRPKRDETVAMIEGIGSCLALSGSYVLNPHIGARDRNRTCDLLFTRQLLCRTELPGRDGANCGAKCGALLALMVGGCAVEASGHRRGAC